MNSALAAGSAASWAYQSSGAVPFRGENTSIRLDVHAVGVGLFVLAQVFVASVGGSPARSFHFARYDAATVPSSTACPQLRCPTMPFSVAFVEPVQTAMGAPFRVSTMNLLCMIVPRVRGWQRPTRSCWLIPNGFRGSPSSSSSAWG